MEPRPTNRARASRGELAPGGLDSVSPLTSSDPGSRSNRSPLPIPGRGPTPGDSVARHGVERQVRARLPSGPMKVSVVRPHELGGAEVTAWGEIQEQERELASPFLAPAFALSAGRVREPARVAILEEDGRTTGVFAFERRWGAIGKPLAA